MTGSDAPKLRVLVDGKPLEMEAAHGVWHRFSAHMDAHQGDFVGFAKSEGFADAAVAVTDGQPTLVLSQSEGGASQALAAPNQGRDGSAKKRPGKSPAKSRGKSPAKKRRRKRRR